MRIIINKETYILISENRIPSSLLEVYNGNLTFKFSDLVKNGYITILDVSGGREYTPESTEKLQAYFELTLIRSKMDELLLKNVREIFEYIVKSEQAGYYEILVLEQSNNKGLLLSLSQNKKTSWLLWEIPVFKIRMANFFNLHFGGMPIEF